MESGSPPAPRAATEGDAAPSPSPSPSPRPSPAPPQPAAESTYNLGRQSTPIATLPYLDARFASLPLALAPLLIPLWLLGSSAYFQPRQARRARPGAGQPHAAWWRRGWAWLALRVSRFGLRGQGRVPENAAGSISCLLVDFRFCPQLAGSFPTVPPAASISPRNCFLEQPRLDERDAHQSTERRTTHLARLILTIRPAHITPHTHQAILSQASHLAYLACHHPWMPHHHSGIGVS